MALDLTNADKVLKEFYIGPVREQFPSHTYYLSQVEKNEKDISGRRAVIPVNKSRNEGVGARGDGGTLPTAGEQGYEDLLIPLKYNYGRLKLTGPTIRAMRNDRGAFIRAIDSEMKGLNRDIKNDANRQLIFGEYKGALAKCDTTSNSTTVQLNTSDPDTMKYMRVGMYVDCIDNDDDSVIFSNRKIESIDRTNKTITISGANVTTDSTHRICRTGSWKKEMNGYQLIAAKTGTFQNVNRATAGNEWWQGQVLDNGGNNRPISDDLLQQLMDLVEEEGDADNIIIITTRGIRRKYVNTLTAQKRFIKPLDLEGGFKAISFDDRPLMVDKDARANQVLYINLPNVQIYRMSDWEWMEEDGSVLHRVSGEDAYEATLFFYGEQGCDRANCHGRLIDIQQ